MPEFIVEADAQKHVTHASFDEDAFVKYLRDNRQISDDNIENISIHITNKDISPMAVANTSPGFMNNGNHIIRISPTRMDADIDMQGRLLRHETEHVIQACGWQYKAWAAGQLSLTGTSSIGSGALFSHAIYESTEALPEPFQIALSTIGALGGAAMGFVVSAQYGKMFSIGEYSARKAEKKYAAQLPDGVLQIGLVK